MKIRLFTTPDCPFSKKTKELLREHGIDFEDNNILKDEKARDEMITISGQMAVPVIEVTENGQEPLIIKGYDEEKIKTVLDIK